MIEYALVPFHAVADHVAKNLPTHYQDVGKKDDYGPPDLDWEYYLQASHQGLCFAVTATDSGDIVAYSVFFISNNANHKTFIEASNGGFFIQEEYRGRLDLIGNAHRLLKPLGVHEINYLLNDDRIGKLLTRKGYEPTHKLWRIRL